MLPLGMRVLLGVPLLAALISCSSKVPEPAGFNLADQIPYLDKAAQEPGAVRTESGLVYRELKAGTGVSPLASDTVKVHYRGTLINGLEFDSSYKRNEPAEFPLNKVIRCWTEGVRKMKVGGKSQLVCPAAIAYGERGAPPDIPAGATLIFEVELLAISGT